MKRKQSLAKQGEKHPFFGKFGKDHPSYGKRLSVDVRAKMSSSHTGMKRPEISGENSSSRRPEVRKKMSERMSGKNNPMWGKERPDMVGANNPMHAPEQRQRAREQKLDKVTPSFNPRACQVIDLFGQNNGYTFQHALNGGEVRMFGYSLDGYDKLRNTIIEYYEHTNHNSAPAIQHDLERMNLLICRTGCVFIVLRERYDKSFVQEIYNVNDTLI